MTPWDIKRSVVIEKKKLSLKNIPFPLNSIMKDGLEINSFLRMKFEDVRNLLEDLQYVSLLAILENCFEIN